ncbi:MAG: hypothetical protein FWE06_02105 [Oscillospiraceae bacterium]|nr:hypothetical protein [Oscillospiraceae bacterium]
MKKIITLALALLLIAALSFTLVGCDNDDNDEPGNGTAGAGATTVEPGGDTEEPGIGTEPTAFVSPFNLLSLPADAWSPSIPELNEDAEITATGGAGEPIVITREGYGWPSISILFDEPILVAEGHRIYYDIDVEVEQYVRIYRANADGSYGAELTLVALEPGNQVGYLQVFGDQLLLGLWIQAVGEGTVTVNGLNIGDGLVLAGE